MFLSILISIMMVLLALVSITLFLCSVSKERDRGDRLVDALIGMMVFMLFAISLEVFGGMV